MSHGRKWFSLFAVFALLCSGGSTEQIAEAARSFGQEDDIAVLTLQYLPV